MHISNERQTFVNFTPLASSSITGVGDQSIQALGRGTVILKCKIGKEIFTHRLQDVLYAPKAVNNLLSVGRLDDAGGEFRVAQGKCELRDKSNQVIGIGRNIRRLYLLDAYAEKTTSEQASIAVTGQDSWDSWHRKYGHLSITGLQQLYAKGMVKGLTIDDPTQSFQQCEPCIQAKQHRQSFPKEAEHRSEQPGELTYSDVWGPARVASIGGSKYYISFTDDHSRRCTPLFMKNKHEAFDKIKEYITHVERKFGNAPKYLRVDNGKELISQKVKDWLKSKGIELQNSAPYSPEQMGVAERFNRTLIELVRAMLIGRNLPSFLWAEAVAHAVYLRNRAPTKALDGKTPHEVWTGEKPDVSHLREFGSDVWVLKEGVKLSKLEPKSKKVTFVGFEDGPKAIRFFDAVKRKIGVSRNFIFAEKEPEEAEWVSSSRGCIEKECEQQPSEQQPSETQREEAGEADKEPTREEVLIPSFLPALEKITPRRSARAATNHNYRHLNNPNSRAKPAPRTFGNPAPALEPIDDEQQVNYAQTSVSFITQEIEPRDVPRTLAEAKASPEWPEWEKAIKAEMDILGEMGTWKLGDLPKGREAVGCKWVFDIKHDHEGKISRYKARLVAQGYSQIPGMDYFETFAPVVRHDSLRAMLAIAAIRNLEIRQLDIKGAYLNGDLQEEIYMRQPEGFDDGSGRVCRLYKTLYGLKQSGREWNRKLNKRLTELGFSRNEVDHCVYVRERNGETTVITVWVDDLLVFTKTVEEGNELARDLKDEFEVNDIGEPKMIIGVKINRDRENRSLTISQKNYIRTVLERFGLAQANPVAMPLDPNIILQKPQEDETLKTEDKLAEGYATVVGAIGYAAMLTRPDIQEAYQILSKFTADPGAVHWASAKRVLRYLNGTRDLGITYTATEDPDVISITPVGYCDADFAGDVDDRKSVSGHTYLLGGGAISWNSKKQTTTALSSTEAEYTAISHATRQAIWLRNLLEGLGYPQEEPTVLYSDNQSAITLTRDAQFHARSKHFDVQNHFVREKVENGIVDIIYVPTDDNIADVFTKALPKPKHQKFRENLGMLTV